MCQKTSRCHGDCCRRFMLPYPPEVMEADYQAFLAHQKDPSQPPPRLQEIEIIGPMIQHLEFSKVRPDGIEREPPLHWYTCKHLRENGDCGIYQTRPRMCSEYPYGGRCEYPGCQSEEARSGLPLPPEQGGVTKHLSILTSPESFKYLDEGPSTEPRELSEEIAKP